MTANPKTIQTVERVTIDSGPPPIKQPDPPIGRLTTKQRAVAGLRKQTIARECRAIAKQRTAERDPVGAHWMDREAAVLELDAAGLLDLPADQVKQGRGGEMVPVIPGDPRGVYFKDTVEAAPSMVTAAASYERMKLATDADALCLGVDLAETVRAKNSAERAIAHQMGAAHGAAMRMFQAGNTFTTNAMNYANADDRARASVEAARCFNAATRLMAAFNESGLAIKKLRSRNGQTVTVIHQHIDNRGGQAMVAGHSVGGGKRRGRK